jgi:hypothetical protein
LTDRPFYAKEQFGNLDALSCTRVVIAHRLSTIQNADLIVVLEHRPPCPNYTSLARFVVVVHKCRSPANANVKTT